MTDFIGPLARAATEIAQTGLACALVALVTRVGILLLSYIALRRKRPFRARVGRFEVNTNPYPAQRDVK